MTDLYGDYHGSHEDTNQFETKIIKREIIKVALGKPFHDPRAMVFGKKAIICLLERQMLYQMSCCFSCGKPRGNGQGVTVFQGVSVMKLKPSWCHVVSHCI